MGLFHFFVIIYLLILVAFVLYGIHGCIHDKFTFRLPPGPKTYPFIGNSYYTLGQRKPWIALEKLTVTLGPIYRFYLGQVRCVVLHGSNAIQTVFSLLQKPFSYRIDSLLPGYNREDVKVCHYGSSYKFSAEKVKLAKPSIDVSELITKLEGKCDKSVDGIIEAFVMDCACQLAFGRSYGEDKLNELQKAGRAFFERKFADNIIYFAMPVISKFDLSPQIEDLLVFQNLVEQLIKEAVENRQWEDSEQWQCLVDSFLSHNLSDQVSSDEMLAMIRDFMLGAMEMTSFGVLWSICYLCNFPDIQKKCQQDIENGNSLFIEAFINEIRRHVTIIPLAVFKTDKDAKVETLNDYQLPPETGVICNLWALHHDSEYWIDPETFRPDRWIDAENGKLLEHSSHFIPFGFGPKEKLSETCAKTNCHAILMELVKTFDFKFSEKDFKMDFQNIGLYTMTNVAPQYEIAISKR